MALGRSKTAALLSLAFCLTAGIVFTVALRSRGNISSNQSGDPSALINAQLGSDDTDELAAGKLLIASRELRDPNFAESVILIVGFEDDGAIGLILNRPAKAPLGRWFPEHRQAKGMTEPVYAGGPVEKDAIMALIRSRDKQDEAERICAGVYLISNRELLEKTVAAGTQPGTFRAYVGYAGWGPSQLEEEVDAGAWHLFPADANTIFDSDPDSEWSRLIRRVEVRVARASSCRGSGNFCVRQQKLLETTCRIERRGRRRLAPRET